MPDNDQFPSQLPESRGVSRKRTRISFVWIVPIVAALAGVWVAATRILGEGPKITLVFHSAEGLEAGKTRIRYNGVEVGTLTSIRLSEDHQKVIATAQMQPDTDDFLVEDTNFWVVRPRISGATVTGLGTLISGAYIGMEIGQSAQPRRRFEALKTPPVVTAGVPGRYFVLETPDLGSLENGTPIFFRRLKVGEVTSFELDKDGKGFTVKVFVNAPYDQYVNQDTRFWHASGVDLSLTANGLSVQTESLLSILIGGLAFETPVRDPVQPPAEENAVFILYHDRTQAFQPPPRNPHHYELVFTQSVRGLAVGAPVEFRGIRIGEVTDIVARIDAKSFDFSVGVSVVLDPERLGVKVPEMGDKAEREEMRRKMVEVLIARGVRAQLRTGSLLTGSLFVALDFFPDAAPAKMDWTQKPVRLPTVPGQVEAIEERLADILRKVDQIPFAAIGQDLQKALVNLDGTLVSARGTLDNANSMVEPNSVLGQQLESTLQEVSGAARALRLLADYLERHPEALIRGKTGEAK